MITFLLACAAVLAACQSGEDDTKFETPSISQSSNFSVDWTRGDSAGVLFGSLMAQGIQYEVVDTEGVQVSEDDVSDCAIVSVKPDSFPVNVAVTVRISISCRTRDWQAETGTEWDTYFGSYSDSYIEGCAVVFEDSSTGVLLSSRGEQLTVDACDDLPEPDPVRASEVAPDEPPIDPVALGQEKGRMDGCFSFIYDIAGDSATDPDGTEIDDWNCEALGS